MAWARSGEEDQVTGWRRAFLKLPNARTLPVEKRIARISPIADLFVGLRFLQVRAVESRHGGELDGPVELKDGCIFGHILDRWRPGSGFGDRTASEGQRLAAGRVAAHEGWRAGRACFSAGSGRGGGTGPCGRERRGRQSGPGVCVVSDCGPACAAKSRRVSRFYSGIGCAASRRRANRGALQGECWPRQYHRGLYAHPTWLES